MKLIPKTTVWQIIPEPFVQKIFSKIKEKFQRKKRKIFSKIRKISKKKKNKQQNCQKWSSEQDNKQIQKESNCFPWKIKASFPKWALFPSVALFQIQFCQSDFQILSQFVLHVSKFWFLSCCKIKSHKFWENFFGNWFILKNFVFQIIFLNFFWSKQDLEEHWQGKKHDDDRIHPKKAMECENIASEEVVSRGWEEQCQKISFKLWFSENLTDFDLKNRIKWRKNKTNE